MTYSFIKLHTRLLLLLGLLIISAICMVSILGQTKPSSEIDWIDCFGEGGIAAMTLIWLLATLLTRPKGKVTNLLFFGLSALHISLLLDFLDEFYRFDLEYDWLTSLEALPATLGMGLMSLAMYYWYHEQQVLNHLLQKKERFYREHGLTDFITGLYRADYMKKQVARELQAYRDSDTGFCMALLDIKGFGDFNRKHGGVRGNSLLSDIGQIITLNLRESDLACRYASDRFIVLLPNTDLVEAHAVIEQVANMVASHIPYDNQNSALGFEGVQWQCMAARKDDDQANLLQRLNQSLNALKAVAA
ncbi:GGDEF domain-containing protein [Pseudoalteromonas phenolica]|uniref:GGDEF domain-containing protein n=1 Tax=Pseudoalteromonas phenolica TaxID=161398 RepID=UPI003850E8E6